MFFSGNLAPGAADVGSLFLRLGGLIWERCQRELDLPLNTLKNSRSRSTSEDEVSKMCTRLYRARFALQNRKKLMGSEHFWKIRSAKCARECSSICASKSQSTEGIGALLEDEVAQVP